MTTTIAESELVQRGSQVLISNYARLPLAFVRGEGSWLVDDEGKRYLDLFPGFGGAILGHCHPDLSEAAADQSLTSEARLALFHVAQEALSNSAKHSRASRVDVQLMNEAEAIVLSLTDNGRGFAPEKVEQRLGHGLTNMRDRARALGGELSLRPAQGGGTEVRVSLPKPNSG